MTKAANTVKQAFMEESLICHSEERSDEESLLQLMLKP